MPSTSSPPPLPEMIQTDVLDSIRRICETNQFHFVVLMQHSSDQSQRYWTSSKPLRNFFGDFISEIATFIDVFDEKTILSGNSGDVSIQTALGEAALNAFDNTDELKMEVDDEESLAANVAEAAFVTATQAAAMAATITTSASTTTTTTAMTASTTAMTASMTASTTVAAEGGRGVDSRLDDDCILLPTEEFEDENEGNEEVEDKNRVSINYAFKFGGRLIKAKLRDQGHKPVRYNSLH